MILTHLALYSFLNGAGAAVVSPSGSTLAPSATAVLAHVRILKESRAEAEARTFHTQMQGKLS